MKYGHKSELSFVRVRTLLQSRTGEATLGRACCSDTQTDSRRTLAAPSPPFTLSPYLFFQGPWEGERNRRKALSGGRMITVFDFDIAPC